MYRIDVILSREEVELLFAAFGAAQEHEECAAAVRERLEELEKKLLGNYEHILPNFAKDE